jgi:hypothetical protein
MAANMKKIANRGLKILSMIFRGICVSAASLLLQACFLNIPNFDAPDNLMTIQGKVRANKTGEPIPGIKISIDNGTMSDDYTNQDGYFKIKKVPLMVCYIIKAEDVDGELNGGLFKEKTLTFQNADYDRTDIFVLIDMDLGN